MSHPFAGKLRPGADKLRPGAGKLRPDAGKLRPDPGPSAPAPAYVVVACLLFRGILLPGILAVEVMLRKPAPGDTPLKIRHFRVGSQSFDREIQA